MGRNVFISYKFKDSERVKHKYRNELIEMLGEEGSIYKGETDFSESLEGEKAEKIKRHLADMLFNTTVTIVLITPNVSSSTWVNWEVQYSLKVIDRKSGKSRTNGLIGVIIPDDNGSYDYFQSITGNCKTRYFKDDFLPSMISKNRFNVDSDSKYTWTNDCNEVVYSKDYGSYCSIYQYDVFKDNMDDLIEISYNKSKELKDLYELKKELNQ